MISHDLRKNYYFFYLSVEFCGAMSCSQLLKHTLTPIKIMIINTVQKSLSIESNPNGWALFKVFRKMFADILFVTSIVSGTTIWRALVNRCQFGTSPSLGAILILISVVYRSSKMIIVICWYTNTHTIPLI